MTQPTSLDPIARLAERQNWLHPAAEQAVQDSIRALFEKLGPSGEPLRRALHGTWLHEPLHAVLTDIPVGSWTAAVLFDALSAVSRNRALDKAADACVLVGLAGAAGAAITGINDWAEIKHPSPRRIGSVHALLNIAATTLFTVSAFRRRKRSTRSSARSLAVIGYLIVSLSAHLGGNLVYEHGIGVETQRHDPLFKPNPAP